MKRMNDPFEGAFDTIQNDTAPTEEQKRKMLSFVLAEGADRKVGFAEKLGAWITVRPWRFAFCASALQTVVCSLVFGAKYTNLLLSIFGG